MGACCLQQPHLIWDGRLAQPFEVVVLGGVFGVRGIKTGPAEDFLNVDKEQGRFALHIWRVAPGYRLRHRGFS